MPTSLLQYEMLPTTWFYVSTLIILTIFFKFNRVISVRNLDLSLLVLLSPGLIFLAMDDSEFGYIWLFAVNGFFLIRLCFDTVMVRRPLLEPNLAPGALTFACFFLFLFILAALTVNRGNKIDTIRTARLEHILTTRNLDKGIGMNPSSLSIPYKELPNMPPGFRPFISFSEHANLASVPQPKVRAELLKNKADFSNWGQIFIAINDTLNNHPSVNNPKKSTPLPTPNIPQVKLTPPPKPVLLSEPEIEPVEKIPLAEQWILPPTLGQMFFFIVVPVAAQFMIVLGFLFIGHSHFGNIRTGAACATLYMLLPYTNQMVGRIDHIVPAALIVWAVAMYRRPLSAGLCIGSAAALVFYPICLVPLWGSFYWRKGWVRFLIGTSAAILVFMLLLLCSPASLGTYHEQLMHLFGKSSLRVFSSADGFWSYHDVIYRVPLLACYFAVCFGMLLWPIHKHLATLISCSAIIMIGTQFWQLHQGGLYIAWYIPLLILTIFRPNLEDKVAQTFVV
ncbi:MAG: DUF2029 domain-containing protein [Planctomycetaceae bacterium]|jgi:hypothetical protein|nr:DUF2029 domain-containing protein [Planctomycetaceae bacterium]